MAVINILIIGPSIDRTKGGMATVINNTLILNRHNPEYKFHHLVSHVEGSLSERISINLKSLWEAFRRRSSYDIVHIHVASKGSFFRKSLFVHLCRLLNKPIVLHVHGADFDKFYFNAKPLIQKFIRYTFSSVEKIFVLSAYWSEFFNKHISSGNVEVVHNGVDLDAFAPCISFRKDFNDFLFLGRLGKRKGIYDLLDAIKRILNERPDSTMHFWLAGDGEIENVRTIIQQQQLSKNVTLVGWLNDQEKLGYLKKVDTLILPSYDEGLPMSILEAMACGKIIISTYVGGIPDLVINEANGYLIQPGDVTALQDRIKTVNEEQAQMRAISGKNIERIAEHYNLKKINEQILNTYKEMFYHQRRASNR